MKSPVRVFLLTLFVVVVQSCVSAAKTLQSARHGPNESHAVAVGPKTPVIREAEEGERRVRRFPGPAPLTIIKVDPHNGGSSEMMMAYTDIPPGGEIPAHWHKVADEIIFVHRGSGFVRLGAETRSFGTGATIYIPKDVHVFVKNTGETTLSIVFVFSKPGWEQFLRDTTVLEGQPIVPLSPAELAEIRLKHSWHMGFEPP